MLKDGKTKTYSDVLASKLVRVLERRVNKEHK